MRPIEIPDELVEHLDRIRYLRMSKQCDRVAVVDTKRHALLEVLKQLDNPTEAEQKLIEEITQSESDCVSNHMKTQEEIWNELCELYEKVRQCCKDMFLDKYVMMKLNDGIVHYIHVRGVKMYGVCQGYVCISGTELRYHNLGGTIESHIGTEYKLFKCADIIPLETPTNIRESLAQSFQPFSYIENSDIVATVQKRKDELVAELDGLIATARFMPNEGLFPDKPSNAEEWW